MSFKNEKEAHCFMKKKGIPIPTKEEADFIRRSYLHNYKKSICPICKEEIYQYIGKENNTCHNQ